MGIIGYVMRTLPRRGGNIKRRNFKERYFYGTPTNGQMKSIQVDD
jgi:hypothetical protein